MRCIWLILLLCLFQACQPVSGDAGERNRAEQGREIAASDLPFEARETLRAIERGGPFAYDRDGVVFGNYEHALPERPRGYYHEYTVKTPGKHGRGTRRIVAGRSGEYYYSPDHYRTFRRIRE